MQQHQPNECELRHPAGGLVMYLVEVGGAYAQLILAIVSRQR